MSCFKKLVLTSAAVLAIACAANAQIFVVEALANSSTGGSGLGTVSLNIGDTFTVSVASNDIWNAGPLKRWSNADGLITNLFATGTDESGYSAGTHIGEPFGTRTQGNLTAPFGALVGRIGTGDFFLVGTNYSSTATSAGTLNLFYWDSNAADNTDRIRATVAAVPEPASLSVLALGALGMLRRRKSK